jgi:hypothetical protein
MRQMISGLVAAIAVVTASAVPAMACGGGLFGGSCSPCATGYVSPCAQPEVYVAPTYSYAGCKSCGGWGYERLPDPVLQYHAYANPVHQYYYVNQGPTYTGPGNFAPYPTYREDAIYGYRPHPHFRHSHYGYRSYRYGYAPRHRYHSMRYAPEPYYYGHRVLRRYY